MTAGFGCDGDTIAIEYPVIAMPSNVGVSKRQKWFFPDNPLRSAYNVIARDGPVIRFHCEAKTIGREDGRPSFIHGVAFDITDLKHRFAAIKKIKHPWISDSKQRHIAEIVLGALPGLTLAVAGFDN